MKRVFVVLLFLVALVTCVSDASAHAIGASNGEWKVDGTTLTARLTFARGEIIALVPAIDPDHDGVVVLADLAAHREGVASKLLPRIVVQGNGACPGTLDELALFQEDGLELRTTFRCPEGSTKITVRLDLLDDLSHGHRHFANVVTPNGSAHPVLYRGYATFEVTATGGKHESTSSWALFRMGLEHILDIRDSYDHIIFLVGLILVGGRPRALALVITAFTLAHSITLALAALNVWAPSPRFVEPAIALSIGYVGGENFFVNDAEKRWRITFPFGLIHGFGFAGKLREINLPRPEIPKALVLFNVGVEVGQLVVLALLLPVVLYLRKFPSFDKVVVRTLSAGIVVAGLVLIVVRIRNPG